MIVGRSSAHIAGGSVMSTQLRMPHFDGFLSGRSEGLAQRVSIWVSKAPHSMCYLVTISVIINFFFPTDEDNDSQG